MIKINGVEFLSTQFIGVGVLNVKIGDRGELRAHSTDWVLKYNDNVFIVTSAMYEELLKGEAVTEFADAVAEDHDATTPSLDEIKQFLIDMGFAVGVEDNGTIIAKPEPPIAIVESSAQSAQQGMSGDAKQKMIPVSDLSKPESTEAVVVLSDGTVKKDETNEEMMARLMGPKA